MLRRLIMAGAGAPPPSGDYFHWSPTDKPAGITLSDSNRVATATAASVTGLRSVNGQWRGKHYIEFVVENYVATMGAGFALVGTGLGTFLGQNASGWALWGNYASNLDRYSNGYQGAHAGFNYASGSVIGLHLDLDNGRAWWSLNGTVISGNPAAGTGPMFTLALSMAYKLAANAFNSGCSIRLRTNPSEHSYSPASGFTAGWPALSAQQWDPGHCTERARFGDNGRRITATGTYGSARAARPCSGLCYYSGSVAWALSGAVAGIGAADETTDLTNNANYPGFDNKSVEIGLPNKGVFWNGGSVVTAPGTISSSPTGVEFAVNTTNRKVWIRVAGAAWAGGGDPAADTSPTVTLAGSGAIFPACWTINGGPPYAATLHVDVGTTTGTPPSGFTAANWA
jgi:hypothetical protein